MNEKTKRKTSVRRESRDPSIPGDLQPLPNLTETETQRIIALLPHGRVTPGDHVWIQDGLERVRHESWALTHLAPELWDTVQELEKARQQLEQLASSSELLLKAIVGLGPLARLRLTHAPERWGVDSRWRVFPDWLREPEYEPDPDFLRRAANAVVDIPREAREQVRLLCEISPKRGRRESLADRYLAHRLYSLWCYFGGKTVPDNSPSDGRSWPFLDFLREVGRTVRPDFKGEAAARKILAKDTKARDELGLLRPWGNTRTEST